MSARSAAPLRISRPGASWRARPEVLVVHEVREHLLEDDVAGDELVDLMVHGEVVLEGEHVVLRVPGDDVLEVLDEDLVEDEERLNPP